MCFDILIERIIEYFGSNANPIAMKPASKSRRRSEVMCIGSKHTPKADGSTGVYTMENTTVVGGEGG